MSNPKRHHYLSQFYLAGFTSNGKKDGDLYCFNLEKRKVRKSKVREEGHERYFNKVLSYSLDENYLERELSKFETDASRVFNDITKNKTLPVTPEDWGILFFYLALLGVRNPAIRESLDDAKTQLMKVALQLLLADSATWDNYKSKFSDDEIKELKNLSFLEAREKILNIDWKIVTHPSDHTNIEISMLEKITDLLSYRKWSLVDATNSNFDFITSDRPVKIFWDDKELGSLNFGPGFGMKSSILFFPVSKKFYLLGSYDRQFPTITANDEMVATINSMQFFYSKRFLYGPQGFFYFDDKDNDNVSSKKYFK